MYIFKYFAYIIIEIIYISLKNLYENERLFKCFASILDISKLIYKTLRISNIYIVISSSKLLKIVL